MSEDEVLHRHMRCSNAESIWNHTAYAHIQTRQRQHKNFIYLLIEPTQIFLLYPCNLRSIAQVVGPCERPWHSGFWVSSEAGTRVTPSVRHMAITCGLLWIRVFLAIRSSRRHRRPRFADNCPRHAQNRRDPCEKKNFPDTGWIYRQAGNRQSIRPTRCQM